mmetsp:Transcript_13977/g.35250  ORF Transcript_13977/g.35250 Transcript_13977/m.35250 type:complete len:192 (-) Transcript_13977:447-1022(-)
MPVPRRHPRRLACARASRARAPSLHKDAGGIPREPGRIRSLLASTGAHATQRNATPERDDASSSLPTFLPSFRTVLCCLWKMTPAHVGTTRQAAKGAIHQHGRVSLRTTHMGRTRRVSVAASRDSSKMAERVALGGSVLGAAVALAPAAQAAQEFAQIAEGEPFLVQLGWGALMASFSFSLCLVVWGRSGL